MLLQRSIGTNIIDIIMCHKKEAIPIVFSRTWNDFYLVPSDINMSERYDDH